MVISSFRPVEDKTLCLRDALIAMLFSRSHILHTEYIKLTIYLDRLLFELAQLMRALREDYVIP
jgi:hypothetical protein